MIVRADARVLWLLRRIRGVCKIRGLDGRGRGRGEGGGGGFLCLNRSQCVSDRASRIGLYACVPCLLASLQNERREARRREETAAVILSSLFWRC
ncbi:unnamed protein product [Ectocarpus sp. 6 AP-2014]